MTAQQLASLLLEAVTRRQLLSTWLLQDLPVIEQLSSAQALTVALAAVRSGFWREVLGGEALSKLLHQLQPQHMYELLRAAILEATFAGDGMQGMWCHAGPCVPVSSAASQDPSPGTPGAGAVIKVLCLHEAAEELLREHVEELLLVAAQLGNAGALAVLLKHLPCVAGVEQDSHLQLLETALQLRNSSMAEVAAAQVTLSDVGWEYTSRVLFGLVRSDDRQQLHRVIDVLDSNGVFVSKYRLLLAALQLRRGSLAASLCKKQWALGERQQLDQCAELPRLLRLAVRINRHDAVEGLLQLPEAVHVPDLRRLVLKESRRLKGLQRACSSGDAVLSISPFSVQAPRRQQQQQQSQPAADKIDNKQQLQQELDAAALPVLQEMLAGQFPSSSAHAMLHPGGTAACCTDDLSNEEWEEVWEVHSLLEAALEQLPAAQQQQAWVALLAKSEYVVHVNDHVKVDLLLAAVHAACVSSWTGSLRVLCRAWPAASSRAAYGMAAAAVQLGCLPVLQLLLSMPAVQQLTADQVASLLR
uniref:Uncharacterized protein n=1 Tax=Tetradesmus obliquus TaxID=3088 RepID=A0A383V496_TETOB|eukprot:jgi/Sobl393_1/7771/SZX59539.1